MSPRRFLHDKLRNGLSLAALVLCVLLSVALLSGRRAYLGHRLRLPLTTGSLRKYKIAIEINRKLAVNTPWANDLRQQCGRPLRLARRVLPWLWVAFLLALSAPIRRKI